MMLFDVILVSYPFSDLSNSKLRPAVVVSTAPAATGVAKSETGLPHLHRPIPDPFRAAP